MIQYPEGLPLPTRDDYGFTPVSPILRTTMATGRARQRRNYASVPTYGSVSWIFSALDAQLFETWFEEVLLSGSQWFEMPLKTPQGLQSYQARFQDIYDGPKLVGYDLWQFTASLELFERPVLKGGWGLYGFEYMRYMKELDIAVNQTWPEA